MLRVWVLVACVLGPAAPPQAAARHAFFRSIGRDSRTRRVFGGLEAPAGAYPGACALLDRGMTPRCSCSVLAPRWALTAAHCAKPEINYVQFNGRDTSDSNFAAVKLLYAHPGFEAVVRDLGEGPDVVSLQHDLGLVRTRGDMVLSSYSYFPVPRAPRADGDIVAGLLSYDVDRLLNKDIDILGYGMTEVKPAGERLREVRLKLASCGREAWRHCACAVGPASGVCSGDSGGPVLYNGTQIGVMSMGPVECGAPAPLGGRAAPEAVSVFTALRPYAALINATIYDVDSALKMREVARSAARRRARVDILCAASLLLRSF
ncbi:chymotrypsin-1-like [Leguminivora glycinivorella]|uniref:chymotrypsin-1-like n=1 Tax=Leguminivora glycinivorella TaxID=1035111 RepID=UPI00200C2390|nr:chymotrypsin-1-like [Leguminivora glycinivorella]